MKRDNKQMIRDDASFKYSDNALCCKWYDNKSDLLLASSIEESKPCSFKKHQYLVLHA